MFLAFPSQTRFFFVVVFLFLVNWLIGLLLPNKKEIPTIPNVQSLEIQVFARCSLLFTFTLLFLILGTIVEEVCFWSLVGFDQVSSLKSYLMSN